MHSASWETWRNVQTLYCVTNEWPFQDHLLNTTLLLQWDLSPRISEWMCRGFLYALYKTICWVSLLNQLDELCLLGDLNKYRGFPVCPLQGHLPSMPIISTRSAPPPWKHEQISQIFPRVTMKWSFQDHHASKTIILSQSSVSKENGLKLYISWENSSQPCLLGERLKTLSPHNLNKWAKSSPVPLRNGLFKTILPLKLCITLKLCLPENGLKFFWEKGIKAPSPWNLKNELSLSQCHHQMAISRPSCH